MTAILSTLSGSPDDDPTAVWVKIPTGYVPLPLDDVRENMDVARDVVNEYAGEEQRPTVEPLIEILTSYLEALAARNALYCGVGHHLSSVDGSAVTSSLVVALQEFPEKVNPRVLLKDLVMTKAAADERGQADLVDVQGRPMLFFESGRSLPTPRLPGLPEVPEDAMTTVYQLEALIPSDDGSKLVSIEFATPFVSHGPEFRAMMVIMANSVSLNPPPPSTAAQGSDQDGSGEVRYTSITGALDG
jgi:hypothetical protein